MSNASCVTCGTFLKAQVHESVQVLACPDGHGMFVDADSLAAAARDLSGDRPRSEEDAATAAQHSASADALAASDAARECPMCHVQMQRQVYAYDSGVHIDVCAAHGIWLDAGELHQIEAWYEAQQRIVVDDMKEWGGTTGRLEQIEEVQERSVAAADGALHWGPFKAIVTSRSWAKLRRDDR